MNKKVIVWALVVLYGDKFDCVWAVYSSKEKALKKVKKLEKEDALGQFPKEYTYKVIQLPLKGLLWE